MVLAKTLLTMLSHIELEQLGRLALNQETVLAIELLATSRKDIRRSPEKISLAIIVDKEIGILQVVQDGRRRLPVARLGIVGIEHAHRAGRIPHDVEQRILVIVGRRRVRTLRIPILARRNELPVEQVCRVPITMRASNKHIILAP